MLIFHSYASLPEGNGWKGGTPFPDMSIQYHTIIQEVERVFAFAAQEISKR